jgi:hypothetical protein
MPDHNGYRKDDYVRQLAMAAGVYMRVGLELLHQNPDELWIRQAAAGNLGVTIELLAKAFVADRQLGLVMKEDSLPVRTFEHVPDTVLGSPKYQRIAYGLMLGTAATRDAEEVLAVLYDLVPEVADEIKWLLEKRLGPWRNSSVHSVYPANLHRLEALGWAALRLRSILADQGFDLADAAYAPTAEDATFLEAFEADRVRALETKVNEAQDRATRMGDPVEVEIEDGYVEVSGSCPVCHRAAKLSGGAWVDEEVEDDDGDLHLLQVIQFTTERLECPNCGLRLEGPWELGQLGLEVSFDATEEISEWASEGGCDAIAELGGSGSIAEYYGELDPDWSFDDWRDRQADV